MIDKIYQTLAQLPGRAPGDVFAGAFGVAAALLLVGGPLFLRYQRNRQRFELLKASIEQGLPPLPDGTPLWLRSLREGLTTLTLGLGLLAVGVVLYVVCSHVQPPARSTLGPSDVRGISRELPTTQPYPGRVQPPFPGGRGPGEGFGDGMGPPDRRPPEDHPPQDRLGQAHGAPGAGAPGADRPQPRPRELDPAEEAWHRAQDAMALAVVAMGSGFVLSLLGLVRIVFSRVEAKYGEASRSQA